MCSKSRRFHLITLLFRNRQAFFSAFCPRTKTLPFAGVFFYGWCGRQEMWSPDWRWTIFRKKMAGSGVEKQAAAR